MLTRHFANWPTRTDALRTDAKGRTPLHTAAFMGNADLCEFLLAVPKYVCVTCYVYVYDLRLYVARMFDVQQHCVFVVLYCCVL